MSLRSTVSTILVTLIVILGQLAPAWAEEMPEEVRSIAAEGRRLFDLERYREAIVLLDEGYDEFQEPIFLQYIGRCYQELGESCLAADHYERFLDEGDPSSRVRHEIESRLEQLETVCDEEDDTPPDEPEMPPGPPPTGPPRTFGPETPDDPPSHRTTDIVGIVFLALGGTAAVVAAVMWGLSYGDYTARNVICSYKLDTEIIEGSTVCPDAREPRVLEPTEIVEWNDLNESRDLRGLVGDVIMFGGAATLLLVGAIVLGVGRSRANSAVSIRPGPGGFSLALTWP